ncbi:uncharacterized protein T551_02814 [Pneumocystis jirovecii RU7]|uniref:Extracellular membrane protein CFEM domain-containing protein n=1 Tax=Pneumocystis jirovecii (strain RU7) TaxID=1408657 RepID=A0A0W4ZHJ7_PNEJ7|nr:uncharacterized protein T551_02814 [Pneumocystis jirovecii RU7]KTW27847.1 hypothetical protein T551_02814 [Pneumocystis jirovecii RU7]
MKGIIVLNELIISINQQKHNINSFPTIDIDNIYLKKDTIYHFAYENSLNNYLSEEKDIYIYGVLEEPFSERYFINTHKEVKDDTQQYESLEKFYVPPYVRRAINAYAQYPDIYFSAIYLIEKIKNFIYFTGSSRNDFSVLSKKISGRFKKRAMVNNKLLFLNMHKRDVEAPECVNFLQKLHESNLNLKTKNCYKNSMVYSGCQSIFDIPCLCISTTYKSAVGTCIYQKMPFDLLDSYEFSNIICSKYSSLSTSCISSLIEDRENIYANYDYTEKNSKTSGKSINKNHCEDTNNHCSGSSILNHFSILIFIFIVINVNIFIELGSFFYI